MREMLEILKMWAHTDREQWQPWKNGLVKLFNKQTHFKNNG